MRLAGLAIALAVLLPSAAAQSPARFSNWEFTAPPMTHKAEQTAERLVLKLDPSVPGAGGTLTLLAGEPLRGELAARLDAEWKRLAQGRQLRAAEPDEQTELADGTKGLKRGAPTTAGGYFSITAYAAPNGVNLLVVDAGDEMAVQALGGVTFGFFATLKLHPVGATALARPAPETPLEELARLQKEMRNAPLPAMGVPIPAEAPKPAAREVEPLRVPRLDKARIAAIPARAPGDAQMPAYLRETAARVEAKLAPAIRALGERIVAELRKSENQGPVALENAAIGLYALGNPRAALHVMGRAAQANPADPTTLNNYAALLNMAGGQQLAIPILRNLEQKFPDDATVLNNLGQAWFGLGDVAKAEPYLERAIRLRAGHSQANLTRCAIQERRGDRRGAAESVKKSMQQGFSEEKAAQLERLGYELAGKDIPWDEPFREDPLKLHKALALVPPYYFKALDVPVAKARWDAYRRTMEGLKAQVDAQQEALKQANEAALKRFQRDVFAGRKRFSPLAVKFTLKYITYGKRHEELIAQQQRWDREAQDVQDRIAAASARMSRQLKADPGASCRAREAIVTEYMQLANGLLSNLQSEARIKARIRWFNEWAQILRYYNAPTEATYRLYLNSLKSAFLGYMAGLQHHHPEIQLCAPRAADPPGARRLQHFEDIHCDRKYSFSIPFIGTIRGNCHYLETEYSAFFVSGTTKEDLTTGEFVRGTLEIGVEIGSGSDKIPYVLETKIEAKAGGFIEFDGNGITDVGATAGVEARVGLDSGEDAGNPFNVSVGASTRMSMNSGMSTSFSGPL